MKILFIGDLNIYARSFWRFQTLTAMSHEVVGVTTVPVPWRPGQDHNFLETVSWCFRRPIDLTKANEKIRQAIKESNFDIVWIEKGNTIKPETLTFVKKIRPSATLVSCSEDDMFGQHNRSFYYDSGLFHYDIVFTTKIPNLIELKGLGAKRTELFLDSYDETFHKPLILTEEEKNKFSCEVGFAGSFEKDRAEKMLFLAEQGLKVFIWGLNWERWKFRHSNLIIKNEHLYREDYAKAINATKINLCFLRKLNRDEVTSRSMEIPACGGFMIAERTKRHLEFFEEDKEAVFFISKEELLEKVRYYLRNEAVRKKIAAAGREKCLKNGYSMKAQLSAMLKKC